jgi:predicted membrane metal-binding protein
MNRNDIAAIGAGLSMMASALSATFAVASDRTGSIELFIASGIAIAINGGIATFLARWGTQGNGPGGA